jgi:carbamoyltransferase
LASLFLIINTYIFSKDKNMIKWGWSGMSHDAALAVMDDDQLVYASHGERYSRIKNDKNLHITQLSEALRYGYPDQVYYYERPILKKARQISAGQYGLLNKQSPKSYMSDLGIRAPHRTTNHHTSHAAYGYYTSGFQEADVLVIDSIGEFETLSYWHGTPQGLVRKKKRWYPHSVGLWYSAMTQRLGLKPQEHEYILMGMAAMGNPDKFYDLIRNDFFGKLPDDQYFGVKFKDNLHRGCQNWRPEITTVNDLTDVAAAVQRIYEEIFTGLLGYMRRHSVSRNLVIVGGCALNCVANTLAYQYYDRVSVPVNPGDAGSSVGAILAHTGRHLHMSDAFLGTDIPGEYPIEDILHDLETTGISAVAAGRAEFGPRALGNRSILADPRIADIRDRVNKLKRREDFRPFAPAVLRERVGDYFEVPGSNWSAPYMQFAVKCLYPHTYPGIVHTDSSSRVQTVHKTISYHDRGLRRLLEAWHGRTGCAMLLNTSLNVKGEPLVNTVKDAERWSDLHGLTVRTPK